MRKRTAISVVVAAALAATAAAVAPATAGPRVVRGAEGFSVKIVAVHDSGCPVGTVWAAPLAGKDAFTVIYSDYLAQAGGWSDPLDARKKCQVVVQVSVPQDVTYAISSSEHRGFAQLESGANATLKVGSYFQGQPPGGMVPYSMSGSYDDIWYHTYRRPMDQFVFKPCGEDPNVVLTTELRVDKGTSDPSKVSFIAMDYTGEGPRTTYHLAWKSCP
ncbi:DUF4360 domain-containing protein [Actinomadura sp. 9N215]|uniref:DUF4360 domain-containing protein n=1 Tax=Actinomadura sp. 9N215 TaxID=3375150 RepID=UPI00379085C5